MPPDVIFPSFPPEFWNSERDVVQFLAKVDGDSVICRLSQEALDDHFGCKAELVNSGAQYLAAFRVNRAAIETKALEKILRRKLEHDGTLVLRTGDF